MSSTPYDLPIDLIDPILIHLYPRKHGKITSTLLACSQVNRIWRAATLPTLFFKLRVRARERDLAALDHFRAFLELLAANPRLSWYVRSLEVLNCDREFMDPVGIRPTEEQITAHHVHLAQWLAQLSLVVVNLELLELRGNRWGTTLRQAPDFSRASIRRLCSYPSLKRLHDGIGLPPSVWGPSQTVTHIKILHNSTSESLTQGTSYWFLDTPHTNSRESAFAPEQGLCKITHLSLGVLTDYRVLRLYATQNLQSLGIKSVALRKYNGKDPPLAALYELFKAAEGSLIRFKIKSRVLRGHLDFTTLPKSLQTLTFDDVVGLSTLDPGREDMVSLPQLHPSFLPHIRFLIVRYCLIPDTRVDDKAETCLGLPEPLPLSPDLPPDGWTHQATSFIGQLEDQLIAYPTLFPHLKGIHMKLKQPPYTSPQFLVATNVARLSKDERMRMLGVLVPKFHRLASESSGAYELDLSIERKVEKKGGGRDVDEITIALTKR